MPASITRSSLQTIPTSIATVSVGTPDTPLEDKLAAISSAWFQAIELGFPDLLSFASTHFSREIGESDYTSLCTAAVEIRTLCKEHNLGIMMLQPFSNFEGWAKGSKERNEAFSRAKGWIRIMEELGTDMLQVGSSDSEGISGDVEVLAGDLGELADMLAKKGYRLAYENWCWATHAVSSPRPLFDFSLVVLIYPAMLGSGLGRTRSADLGDVADLEEGMGNSQIGR